MSRNNFLWFNPQKYDDKLSPFGRKVLRTLIKQWNAEQDRNRSRQAVQRHQYSHIPNRTITFGEASASADCDSHVDLNFEDANESPNRVPFGFPNRARAVFPPLPPPPPPKPYCPPVPSSAQLVAAPPLIPCSPPRPHQSHNFTRDDLITSLGNKVDNNDTSHMFENVLPKKSTANILEKSQFENISSNYSISHRETLELIKGIQNNDDTENINKRSEYRKTDVLAADSDVNWDNMFDTELFLDDEKLEAGNLHTKNSQNGNTFQIIFPNGKTANERKKKTNKKKDAGDSIQVANKRKAQTKVTATIPKKVKKATENKPKQKTVTKKTGDPGNYTETVTNWLEGLDPNNPIEDFNELADVCFDKQQPKNQTSIPELVIEEAPKTKTTKKVIQAQLANKGGVMKFDKPKTDDTGAKESKASVEAPITETGERDKLKANKSKTNDGSAKEAKVSEGKDKPKGTKAVSAKEPKVSEEKDKPKVNKSKTKNVHAKEPKASEEKDKPKEKKSKPKFTAPIKSQIPVKEVNYEIVELEDALVEKYQLDGQNKREIVTVLLYSNGFCQLNEQHTEDSCVPEGLLFQIEEELFFYVDGSKTHLAYTVLRMVRSNSVVCFDGKAIFHFLVGKFHLEFDVSTVLDIIDTKIGGALLEADSPPENFSQLQKCVGTSAQFTVAAEGPRVKAAWYLGLLRAASTALQNKLREDRLWDLFVDIEMKLVPIIADMERRGVRVDEPRLRELSGVLERRMAGVSAACTAAAGRPLQVLSAPQLRTLLYDELQLDKRSGLAVRATETTGAKSTSETMLRSLSAVHPLPGLVLEYRQLHKAHATFLAGIHHHVRDGIVKPTWEQTAAATGRIASNNPNLQAVPKAPLILKATHTHAGPSTELESESQPEIAIQLRSVYTAREGYTIVAADWRHVECRVFARAAADVRLQRALAAPDLFATLAADWLKKPEDQISGEERERTKRIVYASLYGAGPRKLMDILDVDYSGALSIASSFERQFPCVREFARTVAGNCRANGGRVYSLCGRVRRLSDILSDDAQKRAHAERQAVNFIIQGSAADICKIAMVSACEALRERELRARLLLTVHDELVWEVHRGDLAQAAETIRVAMERSGARAGIPLLPVTLLAGGSWGDLEPYTPSTTPIVPTVSNVKSISFPPQI